MDRSPIRELIDGYHAAINLQDWNLLEKLFSDHATWQATEPVNLRFEGRSAVVEGLRQSVLRQELLVQTCSGILIRPTSNRTAAVTSTLVEFGREAASDGDRWMAVGFYEDEVAEADGIWRFDHRTLRVRYLGPIDLGGEVHPL